MADAGRRLRDAVLGIPPSRPRCLESRGPQREGTWPLEIENPWKLVKVWERWSAFPAAKWETMGNDGKLWEIMGNDGKLWENAQNNMRFEVKNESTLALGVNQRD